MNLVITFRDFLEQNAGLARHFVPLVKKLMVDDRDLKRDDFTV